MRALLQSGRKFGELPEANAAVPFGPRFPRAFGILPRSFRGHREYDEGRSVVAGLYLGIAAGETDEGESVEVHVLFSCSARVFWGTWRASGHRSQAKESLFWGDQHGGARRTASEAKQ